MRTAPIFSGSPLRNAPTSDLFIDGCWRIAPGDIPGGIDPRDPDPAYRDLMRRAFYGDIDDATLDAELTPLHCDELLSVLATPSIMTRERFGSVPRHYFRTLEDHTVKIDAQDYLISAVDDAMVNRTVVHTLSSGHSPHVTQPAILAAQLSALAGNA
jgi:hypothetical protein